MDGSMNRRHVLNEEYLKKERWFEKKKNFSKDGLEKGREEGVRGVRR
jgi:hypothetical protein